MRLLLFGCFFGLVIWSSCKNGLTGNKKNNLPPDTHTAVDSIKRVGPNRMQSQVSLQWWGDDPDGVVKGFEFTFDSVITPATLWHFTTRNDSTFILQIPAGHDSIDFQFYVRAVDNFDLRDPTPSHLGVPVKNSPPTIAFVAGPNNPTKTFPVLKFYWQATDPDGADNLKQIEAVWNDTLQTPFVIDIAAQSATFEAVNPSANASACNVYINNSLTALASTMPGLLLNDTNKLFIRAVDNSLARSQYVGSYTVFVKKVSSPILLVDGYGNFGSSVTNFYAQHLQANGIAAFDTMQIFYTGANGKYTQQSPDNLTQARVFKLFHDIVWYSNDATKTLSLGQKTLGGFFNNGGKLFLATYVSSSFDQQSTFLDFTPAQMLVPLPTDTVLQMNNASTLAPLQTGYPNLQNTSIIGTVRPFVASLGSTALYSAQLVAKNTNNGGISAWNGIATVMAKKSGSNGQTNFIFSVLELQKLDGLNNMDALFQKVFVGELAL